MSESEARIQIKAIAYAVAAALGWRRAYALLQEVARALESEAWRGDR